MNYTHIGYVDGYNSKTRGSGYRSRLKMEFLETLPQRDKMDYLHACHHGTKDAHQGKKPLYTMNEVTRELCEMQRIGINVSERCLAASRDDAEVEQYLDSCMSVSDVADLFISLYN